MRVAVLGSGIVGKTLAAGFAARGHEAVMGSRTPDRADITDWLAGQGPTARAASLSEAAAFGELAVLATRWDGTKSAIDLTGPEHLAGKVVIDATNPMGMRDGRLRLLLGFDESAGEWVQQWLPDSKVVKAFNSVSYALMIDPDLPGGPPDMFIAGDDGQAKAHVTTILHDFGWPVIDAGDITASRLLEPLAMLHADYWVRTGELLHAFRMLMPTPHQ
ncbi:NAD(P)-binding domain-containing protein [Actinomadura barringtoniae]|uniref:NAD(P)-binding domain-containing protein n=1 Tax=Actinomadura barringtoniae TaxID=1427535 RepID=A0A939P614_9ACTN|nr:NAD(P)-binding domain-containing protein [Actinomadura barringtoniae]MBO2445925.1 NAD(P)-binding domain-containing protein [Actinomadura barringtoniae]